MDPTHRGHHATITTPSGSVVTMPVRTEAEAEAIAEAYGPPGDPLPARPVEAEGETTSCGKCGGQGSWTEKVEITTPSGGKVVTEKRVNCRTCGGTGQVPKPR